jgi:hypothetical protein
MQPLALLTATGAALLKNGVLVEEALSCGTGLRQLTDSDDPKPLRSAGRWSSGSAAAARLAPKRSRPKAVERKAVAA